MPAEDDPSHEGVDPVALLLQLRLHLGEERLVGELDRAAQGVAEELLRELPDERVAPGRQEVGSQTLQPLELREHAYLAGAATNAALAIAEKPAAGTVAAQNTIANPPEPPPVTLSEAVEACSDEADPQLRAKAAAAKRIVPANSPEATVGQP